MATSELNTTQRKGSLDLLTTEDGEIPEFLINGVPLIVQTPTTVAPGDTVLTTTGSQVITCLNTGSLIITLNSSPIDTEQVTVSRRVGPVTISGAINGGLSITLLSVFDTADLVFSDSAAEWLIT
jgi:hypothetical protein